MATLRENETLISQTEPDSEGIYTRVIIRETGKVKEHVTQRLQQFLMYRSKHSGWLNDELAPVPGQNAVAYRKATMKPFGAAIKSNDGVTGIDSKLCTFIKDTDTQKDIVLPTIGIKCRNCGLTDHLTFACKMPSKDEPTKNIEVAKPTTKYVPPAARKGYVEENRCLRISNLSYDCTEADLRVILSEYGRIERLRIGYDPVKEICKGWAFVTYTTGKSATLALAELDKCSYGHTILDVSWADA